MSNETSSTLHFRRTDRVVSDSAQPDSGQKPENYFCSSFCGQLNDERWLMRPIIVAFFALSFQFTTEMYHCWLYSVHIATYTSNRMQIISESAASGPIRQWELATSPPIDSDRKSPTSDKWQRKSSGVIAKMAFDTLQCHRTQSQVEIWNNCKASRDSLGGELIKSASEYARRPFFLTFSLLFFYRSVICAHASVCAEKPKTFSVAARKTHNSSARRPAWAIPNYLSMANGENAENEEQTHRNMPTKRLCAYKKILY